MRRVQSCLWCGRQVDESELGRRRRYCRQSCRQRAYEHRKGLEGTGIPEDAVVLSAAEAADLADRWFAARCAAEDVATAVAEGAGAVELSELTATLVKLTKDAERLR
ncbi:hypothetical protein IU500_32360 [Nocardia terpenica]|uniref:Uncharacterized protein n=1 Tax=Nocardia terpenica TaxID=455432 RepID=A0A164M2W7_9NOCA|nr:hypothetical protein [Nocardia terpenica]ATL67735.1 hypothetical protein CRH09_17595 [Nocardia terpenica]KZM72981.1 hypothetical protein AWN90_30025 [Nocardia terpenica]MBF6061076.1 hypothetical protein [Nocardia terpenica]MBF6108712.1 hypothetical protein [Nocardia terpenica]MBF6114102.1 hypothetical protein [Nocardia terpenica]